MVSVQTEGCAPIIRAFASGAETAGTWDNAHTVADGLRVPRAIADFLILRTIRESGGTAVAVSDAIVEAPSSVEVRSTWRMACRASLPRRGRPLGLVVFEETGVGILVLLVRLNDVRVGG